MQVLTTENAPLRFRAPREPFVARGSGLAWRDLQTITLEWLVREMPDVRVPVFAFGRVDGKRRETSFSMQELADHVSAPHRDQERWYLVEDFTLARRLRLTERLRPYVKPFLPWPSLLGHSALWVGPARSRTGLHADPDGVNILVMVRGEKRFLLIPPEDTPYLARDTRYDGGAWASGIDVFALDATRRWPEYRKARKETVVLKAGDMLYVPRHWWHAVENLEQTIAVSYRAETLATALLNIAMPVQFILHHLGLYRRGNCTCHAIRVPA